MTKIINTMTAAELAFDVMQNKACPYWVKSTLQTMLDRDPVDALNWIELLHAIAEKRVDESFIHGKAL